MGTEESKTKKYFEKGSIVEKYKTHDDFNLFSRRRVVFDMLKNTHFKRVVDLGCGSGGYLRIKKLYNCLYFGLDFSENMIKAAKERAKDLGIEEGVFFEIGDAKNTPYPNDFFDLVLAICLIEYFEKPDELIKEIMRILKEEGVLIIQSFIPNPYVHFPIFVLAPIKDFITGKREKIEHKQFNKKQLDNLLIKNGFQLVDFAYSNFNPLPVPFRTFFPKIHVKFSEYLARKNPKRFGFLALNYIAKYYLTTKYDYNSNAEKNPSEKVK